MYCPKCGYLMSDLDAECPRCAKLAKQAAASAGTPAAPQVPGTPQVAPPAAAQQSASAMAQDAARVAGSAIREASTSAFRSFTIWATDPVGGLPRAYSSIDPRQALMAGIVFGIACALCITASVMHYDRAASHALGSGDVVQIGLWGYVKVFLSGLAPFVAFAAVGYVMRAPAKKGTFGGDVFSAGAAVLPLGVAVLLTSLILTTVRSEADFRFVLAMATAIGVFGFCYTTLILFSGATRIAELSERAAAIAVPLMWLLGGWLTMVLLNVLWHGSMSAALGKAMGGM